MKNLKCTDCGHLVKKHGPAGCTHKRQLPARTKHCTCSRTPMSFDIPPGFYKTPNASFGYTFLAPACHIIDMVGHYESKGDTACGYYIEPEEVAGQTFTSDPTRVTCGKCIAWLARKTEHKLKGRA